MSALRLAAALLVLFTALAAPELPALVPFQTLAGRAAAAAALTILAIPVAWGGLSLARHRDDLRVLATLYSKRPVAVLAAALVWVIAVAYPVHRDRLSLTAIYEVVVSVLAPAAGLVATTAAAALLAPPTSRSARPRPLLSPTVSLLLAAAAAFTGASILAVVAFGRAPHIPDEIAYLFDARVFAAGRRFATPPPVPDAFPPPEWIEIEATRAYGVFPPGWPLLLALGVKGGVPGLVNPLASVLLVLVSARLALLCGHGTEARTGRTVGSPLMPVWLLAASPFLLVLAASFMAHVAAALWTALALAAYLSRSEAGGRRSSTGLALALAAALLLLTRPIEAAAIAAACLAEAVIARMPARRRWGATAWLLAGLAGGTLLLLADQARVTGSPFVPPVNRYFDLHHAPGVNRLGFGADVGLGWESSPPGHSPSEALWNLSLNLAELNRHLHGWPAGSLLLPLIFLFGTAKTRGERLLSLHAAFTIVLYAFYWYHGVVLGPRFLTSLLPALAIFSWRGATVLATWLERECPGRNMTARVQVAIALSIACALALYLPLKVVSEYRGLRGVDPSILSQIEAAPAPVLALVAGPRWPDVASAFFLNAPDFRGPRVVAQSRGPAADSTLAAIYPLHTPRIVGRGRAVGGMSKVGVAGRGESATVPGAPGTP